MNSYWAPIDLYIVVDPKFDRINLIDQFESTHSAWLELSGNEELKTSPQLHRNIRRYKLRKSLDFNLTLPLWPSDGTGVDNLSFQNFDYAVELDMSLRPATSTDVSIVRLNLNMALLGGRYYIAKSLLAVVDSEVQVLGVDQSKLGFRENLLAYITQNKLSAEDHGISKAVIAEVWPLHIQFAKSIALKEEFYCLNHNQLFPPKVDCKSESYVPRDFSSLEAPGLKYLTQAAWVERLRYGGYSQDKAIEYWVEQFNTPAWGDLYTQFLRGDKAAWVSLVRIFSKVPLDTAVAEKLCEFIADPNWPGHYEAYEYLRRKGSMVLSYLDNSISIAMTSNDIDWAENLRDLRSSIVEK